MPNDSNYTNPRQVSNYENNNAFSKYTEIIQFRCTPGQKVRIEKFASEKGRSVSIILRHITDVYFR